MRKRFTGSGPADRVHRGRATPRGATVVLGLVVVSLAAAITPSGPASVAATGSMSPLGAGSTTTVPRNLEDLADALDLATVTTPPPSGPAVPPATGGGRVFTFGEISIPPGEPGQISVVLARPADHEGHMPIVVRNNREHTIYDLRVRVVGGDASGAEVGIAEYFIPTAGVAPGDWVFGQNVVPAPGLAQATNYQLQLSGTDQPLGFVGLDVTAADVVGGVVTGTIVNASPVTLSDFIVVNVACFDGSGITSYTSAMPELVLSRLGPGEPAHFATTRPIDPAECTAIAVHAIGAPET